MCIEIIFDMQIKCSFFYCLCLSAESVVVDHYCFWLILTACRKSILLFYTIWREFFLENSLLSQWECNSRLLQSHMRLKKKRAYNHWLKSQGHYLLCFSTSRTVGANSVRLRHETRTCYSLKATTKISPHSRK